MSQARARAHGWKVAVETNGQDGWGYYYLDANGDPFANNPEDAHIWSSRAAALMQAEKWKNAKLVWNDEVSP